MRKFLVITIPVITLIFFILVMVSGNYLKQPMGKNDDVPGLIKAIAGDAANENWQLAEKNRIKLKYAWKKVVHRIQFSSERDEINAFDTSLSRLRGAIMAEDKTATLVELNEAYGHWDDLGK